MKAIFDNTGKYLCLTDDSFGLSGYIEKDIMTLPGPPERCVWIGDVHTGKLVSYDSMDYNVFLSQQEHYDTKITIYETEQKRICTDKIIRQGYDIHDQLNIIRKALLKIVDDEDLKRMEKVITNITDSYAADKEKFQTNPNFEYVNTIREKEEQFQGLNKL